jgi:hypothetical protein
MNRRVLLAPVLACLACGSSESASNPAADDAATTDSARIDGAVVDALVPDAATDLGDGARKDPPPPPPIVGACDGLGAVGAFEDVTPPEVKKGMATGGKGTFAFAVDPVHQGTIYLGTNMAKVWKSTDCGATWTHPNTGRTAPSSIVG